jgi:thymidylate synthase ThyX
MTSDNFFSNQDKRVFILKMENQVDRGALLSRYSRTSSLDIRELYRKEFQENPDRGKKFYERVFLEYGDESVAELISIQIGIQGISNIVTKLIEECRVGLSYLEKSSRYVSYEKKVDGKYLFLDFEKTGIAKKFEGEYNSLMEKLFEFYSYGIPIIKENLKTDFPLSSFQTEGEDSASKAYETAVRSRTLDDMRAILPSSTLTNMGISGNIRAFIHLIQKLDQSGIPEAKEISDLLYDELFSEFENLVKSARDPRYTKNHEPGIEQKETQSLSSTDGKGINSVDVTLTEYNKKQTSNIGNILCFSNPTYIGQNKKDIIDLIADERRSRRDKLPRAFEFINLTYRIVMNYGAFREFQRHRFMSILRKDITPEHGYYIPEYVSNNPDLSSRMKQLLDDVGKLYIHIRKDSGGKLAQYVLPYCTNYEILVNTNLRELAYFSELRSTPQSHPDLRETAIKMVGTFLDREPEFKPLFKFVDYGKYPLGRFFQEYRKEEKIKKL